MWTYFTLTEMIADSMLMIIWWPLSQVPRQKNFLHAEVSSSNLAQEGILYLLLYLIGDDFLYYHTEDGPSAWL